MELYQSLLEFADSSNTQEISKLSPELTEDLQELLTIGEFFKSEINSKFSPELAKAFSEFKEKNYLQHPTLLGKTTALSLLELAEERSEQKAETAEPESEINNHNSKTGKQMQLPGGEIVYQNQRIIDEIPLTWGEVTKGCTRVPTSRKVVQGIKDIAIVFGDIRDIYGKPITITSGYRDPKTNRRIGGAIRSQHLTGRALDIFPSDGNLNRLYEVCRARNSVGGLGNGKPKGFVHIDARGHRVYWNY